jgi:hypothetical protein
LLGPTAPPDDAEEITMRLYKKSVDNFATIFELRKASKKRLQEAGVTRREFLSNPNNDKSLLQVYKLEWIERKITEELREAFHIW